MANKTPLRIGLVGYGFMGRTHTNAWRQAGKFFDLPYEPVLQAISARSADKAEAFADNWGYASFEDDWRRLVERDDIDLIDIASPNDTHTCNCQARVSRITMKWEEEDREAPLTM